MNLKDFFEKNPGLLEQFKKCSSKDEFMKVAQENNVRFAAGKLDEVYEYIQSAKNDGELSEDALSAASGGVSQIDMGDGSPTTIIQ